ncbi:MAG TPA: hypothetical protein VGM92_11635, partial [Candidatus Kapabacteria bacterium]
MLSFLAAKVEAQIDSNAMVCLYCGPVSDGCNIVLLVPPGETDTFSESLTVDFNGSYRISEEDHSQPGTKFGVLNPPFEIDTVNKEIVNLQVYRATSGGTGENALLISFPPIPYFRNNSLIVVNGS